MKNGCWVLLNKDTPKVELYETISQTSIRVRDCDIVRVGPGIPLEAGKFLATYFSNVEATSSLNIWAELWGAVDPHPSPNR